MVNHHGVPVAENNPSVSFADTGEPLPRQRFPPAFVIARPLAAVAISHRRGWVQLQTDKKQRRQRWLQPPFFAGKLRDAPAGRRAGKTRAHVGRKCAGGGEERTQSRSSDFRIVGACAAFSVSQWRTFVPARGLRDHSGGTVRVLHPIPYSPPYPKRARRHFEPVFYFHAYSIATAMRNVKGMQNGSNDFSIQKYGILLTFRKTAGIMKPENQTSARRDRVAATAEQQAARQARW